MPARESQDGPFDRLPGLITDLYGVVRELETLFPGRPFTPDGHLVGSIGEAIAAYLFDLHLTTPSSAGVDAIAPDGSTVEIKITQRNSVALRGKHPLAARLVVLKLHPDGVPTVAYNGPTAPVWRIAGPVQSNGQRQVSLSRLRQVGAMMEAAQRLSAIRELPGM
jgi:hypothetical protein